MGNNITAYATYRIKRIHLIPGDDRYGEDFLPTIIPPSRIVYPDLVFTLSQDPSKYYRPVAEVTQSGLVVLANNTFLRAASELAFDDLNCDVMGDTSSLDHAILGDAGATRATQDAPAAPDSDTSDTFRHFLFFNLRKASSSDAIAAELAAFDAVLQGETSGMDEPCGTGVVDGAARTHQKRNFTLHEPHECLEYLLTAQDCNDGIRFLRATRELRLALAHEYGSLRSVNGIRDFL